MEFVPDGHGITGDHYLGIMRCLHNTIRRRRPDLWRHNTWILHHDGAPAHRACRVWQFNEQTATAIHPQPPYSPDLAPADFWLFERIKRALRGSALEMWMDSSTRSVLWSVKSCLLNLEQLSATTAIMFRAVSMCKAIILNKKKSCSHVKKALEQGH